MTRPIKDLKTNKKEVGGKVNIFGTEQKPGEEVSTVSFNPIACLGHNLEEKDIKPKDKVFLIFSAQGSDGKYFPVIKTECQCIPHGDRYQFNRVRTNSRILANHDENQFFVVTAYKFADEGKS